MRLDTTLNRITMFQEQYRNLWRNIVRFRWSHADYLKYRLEIQNRYEKLPRWAVERLSGYDYALYQNADQHHVFSYIVDGVRVTTESDVWNDAIGTIHEREKAGTFTTDSGEFVWREDTSKMWTNKQA